MEPTKNSSNSSSLNNLNTFGSSNTSTGGISHDTNHHATLNTSTNSFGNANPSLDPIFQGMPKPGQPLTSVPKISQVPADSPFQRSAPSAFDRLMNPNLDKVEKAVPYNAPHIPQPINATNVTASPSSAIPTPASSFKPFTPTPPATPTVTPAPTPKSTAYVPSSSPFAPASTASAVPTPASTSTPAASMSSSPFSTSNSTYNSSVPPTASSFYTQQPVVSSTVKNSTPPVVNSPVFQSSNPITPIGGSPKKSGLGLIISSLVVLLLVLLGGGYYWYTTMYMPNRSNTADSLNGMGDNALNSNTTSQQSSQFPSSVSKPVNSTITTTTFAPTKATLVVTPLNAKQRTAVSNFIFRNINSLAPIKSKKLYEVTDITFDGPDRAIVLYTNRTNSYAAVAVATIDTAGKVTITSFTALDK